MKNILWARYCSKGLHGVTHLTLTAMLISREHYYLSLTDGEVGPKRGQHSQRADWGLRPEQSPVAKPALPVVTPRPAYTCMLSSLALKGQLPETYIFKRRDKEYDCRIDFKKWAVWGPMIWKPLASKEILEFLTEKHLFTSCWKNVYIHFHPG